MQSPSVIFFYPAKNTNFFVGSKALSPLDLNKGLEIKTKLLPIILSIFFLAVLSARATVTSTQLQVTYVGNGSVSIYQYPYKIFKAADLAVTTYSASATTALALNTNYTVGNIGFPSGSITLLAGNLAAATTISITRIEPLTQLTSFRNQGTFIPANHEDALDKLTMIAQQLAASAGVTGAPGPVGPTGPTGPTGPSGAGPISFYSVANQAALPANPGAPALAYEQDNGLLWFWSVADAIWEKMVLMPQ